MKLKTKDLQALKNLIALHRKIDKNKKTYQGLIHPKTGDMRFFTSEEVVWDSKEWERIHLLVKEDSSFLLDVDEKKIDQKARKVIRETMRLLNERGDPFEGEEEVVEKPYFLGKIDRFQAEALLEDKKVGTYLLRTGDDDLKCFHTFFDVENKVSSRLFVLTIKKEEDKIGEMLIFHLGNWFIYCDEVKLECYLPFSSLEALIGSIPEAKYPYA